MKKTETRFDTYNKKCKFFSIRMREGKDDKYIEFLKNCPNRMGFIRDAIDKALSES
jgi:hypothetical protein